MSQRTKVQLSVIKKLFVYIIKELVEESNYTGSEVVVNFNPRVEISNGA